MCVYLRIKFQVSSIILTSFRRGNFTCSIGITLLDILLNWLSLFHFLILEGVLLLQVVVRKYASMQYFFVFAMYPDKHQSFLQVETIFFDGFYQACPK